MKDVSGGGGAGVPKHFYIYEINVVFTILCRGIDDIDCFRTVKQGKP